MKILIAGKKGSGKTTLANILANKTQFPIHAYADGLKRACALVSSIPLKNFHTEEYKEKPFIVPLVINKHTVDALFMLFGYTPEHYAKYTDTLAMKCLKTPIRNIREFLQFVGTDILRAFDENIHINFLKKNITENSIVSDIRFKNELDAFKSEPHVFVYIERTSDSTDTHRSEEEVLTFKDQADIVIVNDGSLEDLEASALKILEKAGIK